MLWNNFQQFFTLRPGRCKARGRALSCPALLLACTLLVLGAANPCAARDTSPGKRRATMPVVTSAMKQQAEASSPSNATPPEPGQKAEQGVPLLTGGQTAEPAGSPASPLFQPQAVKPSAAGLAAFSTDPLGIGKNQHLHQLYGGNAQNAFDSMLLEKARQPALAEQDTPLTITGKSRSAPASRLEPQQQAPFMGGEHTLPYMDAEPNAEVSMEYKITPKATTRLVVNPQDPNSPLYRPAEQDKGLNSGGLYMDVNVSQNMQVKVGGEYCEVEESGQYGATRSSQGVAVGVEWNF